jgi:hypothetical protein
MSRSKKDIVDAAVREYVDVHRDEINAGVKTALGHAQLHRCRRHLDVTGLSADELGELGGLPK